MPHRVSRTFQTRRALLRHLAPRYQQASSAQKTLLLNSFVAWTGYTRKYAITLLNHGEQDQEIIQRRRLPRYSPQVQQALFVAWKATHYVCAKRLLPSLPSLVALLEGHGHLQLNRQATSGALAGRIYTVEPTGDVTFVHVRLGEDLAQSCGGGHDGRHHSGGEIFAILIASANASRS